MDTSGAPGSTIRTYLDEAARVPLLTAAEEIDLAKRAAAGQAAQRLLDTHRDHPRGGVLLAMAEQGRRASERMVCANLRLVVTLARRYVGRGNELADLVQDGNLGLIKAVDRFDPTRGYRFSTYAAWWIRQSITRGIADRGRTIRLPVHAHELVIRLRWLEVVAWQETGQPPTEHELAQRAGVPVERVRELFRADADLASLDVSRTEGGEDLSSLVADPDAVDPAQATLLALASEQLRRALAGLEERERRVLELRFGLTGTPCTLQQIGHELGVTRERIRQLEQRALRQLAEVPALPEA